MIRFPIFRMCIFLQLLLLAGCGIDRGGITAGPDPDIPPPISAVGPRIDAGVLVKHESEPSLYYIYDGLLRNVFDPSSDTTIMINGDLATVEKLEEGMYVHSYYIFPGPTIWNIDFNVAGGVPLLAPSTLQPTIFGAEIFTTTTELVTPVANLLVNPSDGVAISGYTAADGAVDATAIIDYPNSSPRSIFGFARDVDTAQFTFNLGGQTIDYSEAILIETETGSIEEYSRLRVEVEIANNSTELQAVHIIEVPTLGPDKFLDTEVRVVNYVSSVIDEDRFRIGDVIYKTSFQSTFENVPNTGLTTEALVSVYGLYDDDGTVFAFNVTQLN